MKQDNFFVSKYYIGFYYRYIILPTSPTKKAYCGHLNFNIVWKATIRNKNQELIPAIRLLADEDYTITF